MGMYDSVKFFSDKPKCGAGHEPEGWQTKDLKNDMATYYVVDGRFYGHLRSEDDWQEKIVEVDQSGIVLSLTHRSKAEVFTGSILVYTHCKKCQPVFTDVQAVWNDGLAPHEPWVEYELTFADGVLVKSEPVKLETRESMREDLTKHGLRVMPDDDRVVQKRIQQWREGKR